jgi:hypothetical protein
MAHKFYLQQLAQGSPGGVPLLRPPRALLWRWELAQSPAWLAEAQAEQSPYATPGDASSAARATEPTPLAAPPPHAISRPVTARELTASHEVRREKETKSKPEPAKEDGPKAQGVALKNQNTAPRPASLEERKDARASLVPRLEPDEWGTNQSTARKRVAVTGAQENRIEPSVVPPRHAPMPATSQPPFPATKIEFEVRPAKRKHTENGDELSPVGALAPHVPARSTSSAGGPAEVRIGTVEIVVTAPAPPQGTLTPRAPAGSPPALSRGYLSTIGLRQR